MLSTQPDILKGGLILLDPDNGKVVRTLPMLINPAKLSRSFEIKSLGEESGQSSPLRLTGPAVETITLEAKLEVSDALARGEATAAEEGVRPHLAALLMLVTPSSESLTRNDALQQSGALEIIPMDQPLTLFVWGPAQIATSPCALGGRTPRTTPSIRRATRMAGKLSWTSATRIMNPSTMPPV